MIMTHLYTKKNEFNNDFVLYRVKCFVKLKTSEYQKKYQTLPTHPPIKFHLLGLYYTKNTQNFHKKIRLEALPIHPLLSFPRIFGFR